MTASLFPVAGRKLTAQQVQDQVTAMYGAFLFWDDGNGGFQTIHNLGLTVGEWSKRNPAGSQVTQGGDLGVELDGMNQRWTVARNVLFAVVTSALGSFLGIYVAHRLGVF